MFTKAFCENYEVKRIYFVSDDDFELYDWENFFKLKSGNIKTYFENDNIIEEDDEL